VSQVVCNTFLSPNATPISGRAGADRLSNDKDRCAGLVHCSGELVGFARIEPTNEKRFSGRPHDRRTNDRIPCRPLPV
jgi:hypothetical protein